jgi:hypothetical protein
LGPPDIALDLTRQPPPWPSFFGPDFTAFAHSGHRRFPRNDAKDSKITKKLKDFPGTQRLWSIRGEQAAVQHRVGESEACPPISVKRAVILIETITGGTVWMLLVSIWRV